MQHFTRKLSRRMFGRSVIAAAAAMATPVVASDSPVRLTIVGRKGTRTLLTDADLDRLAQVNLDTTTFWTDGVQHFEGVLLRDVLAVAGIDPAAEGGNLEAEAYNEYAVRLPLSDAVDWDVLLARRMNGHVLTLRDKGPLWIVYPRDQHPALLDNNYNHRWVWQLRQFKLL